MFLDRKFAKHLCYIRTWKSFLWATSDPHDPFPYNLFLPNSEKILQGSNIFLGGEAQPLLRPPFHEGATGRYASCPGCLSAIQ